MATIKIVVDAEGRTLPHEDGLLSRPVRFKTPSRHYSPGDFGDREDFVRRSVTR